MRKNKLPAPRPTAPQRGIWESFERFFGWAH